MNSSSCLTSNKLYSGPRALHVYFNVVQAIIGSGCKIAFRVGLLPIVARLLSTYFVNIVFLLSNQAYMLWLWECINVKCLWVCILGLLFVNTSACAFNISKYTHRVTWLINFITNQFCFISSFQWFGQTIACVEPKKQFFLLGPGIFISLSYSLKRRQFTDVPISSSAI